MVRIWFFILDIEPASPYEPSYNYSFTGYGHAQGYSRGIHPSPDNFIFDRTVHPELPGFTVNMGMTK